MGIGSPAEEMTAATLPLGASGCAGLTSAAVGMAFGVAPLVVAECCFSAGFASEM
jgi:hypothetical protein